MSSMNSEQYAVYDSIMSSVNDNLGKTFFVYGYGGTGKTFVWRGLSSCIRSNGGIVLNVASSGIASLLLPGGRTAHSRFKIPLHFHENSTCSINLGTQLSELIVKSSLIIWDEAPMMHKHCFEALDKTLKDVLKVIDVENGRKLFGGKTVVFGGDFRQILPVIPKGRRQDIVNATINASYIWNDCIVLRLTKNMRLQCSDSNDNIDELKQFADWIADIGDGKVGEGDSGSKIVDIPKDLLIDYDEDPIKVIVQSTFPSFPQIGLSSDTFCERAILAPTNEAVDAINDYMISLNTEKAVLYYSSDSSCNSDLPCDILGSIHTTEYLNGIKCSGIPNHILTLKVGTPIMLLRNIDPNSGLCNGTRMIITRLGTHILEAKVMTGANAGQILILPRMTLTSSDPRIPFKFQRRQFPIAVSYAMTINKSQGQSLSYVGLYLPKSVFTHGQLYVAISRVTNRKGLKILLCEGDDQTKNSTTNVVYQEVFHNL